MSSSMTSSLSTSGTTSSGPGSTGPFVRTLDFSVPEYKKILKDGADRLRISIAPMGNASSETAFIDQSIKLSDRGKISMQLGEPKTEDPSKASKLRQFMVTLYRDRNGDQKAGKGDEFIATLLEFLVYRADAKPEIRWRKFDPETRKAISIKAPINMVTVGNRIPRKAAQVGGKVSQVPKDIAGIALFSEKEKLDLKKNFMIAVRSLDEKLERDKLFWETEVSGNMDRLRWAAEKRPVISGIGRHGLAWFGGYHTPTPTLIPTVRRNSRITDELCHRAQPLIAIWIQKSDEWITSMSGAFLVAYHDLAPGWNIVKIDRSKGKKASFHQISKKERYDLTFSPVCSGWSGPRVLPESQMGMPTFDL